MKRQIEKSFFLCLLVAFGISGCFLLGSGTETTTDETDHGVVQDTSFAPRDSVQKPTTEIEPDTSDSDRYIPPVIERGQIAGTIHNSAQEPKAKAAVFLYKRNTPVTAIQSAPEPVAVDSTDEQGRFSFYTRVGEYSIVASENGKSSFIDSISLQANDQLELEGTLLPPGRLQGTIGNYNSFTSGTIAVHLVGTSFFNKPGSENFSFVDVPAGVYELVIYDVASPNSPQFQTTRKTVQITSDSITRLDTLNLSP